MTYVFTTTDSDTELARVTKMTTCVPYTQVKRHSRTLLIVCGNDFISFWNCYFRTGNYFAIGTASSIRLSRVLLLVSSLLIFSDRIISCRAGTREIIGTTAQIGIATFLSSLRGEKGELPEENKRDIAPKWKWKSVSIASIFCQNRNMNVSEINIMSERNKSKT